MRNFKNLLYVVHEKLETKQGLTQALSLARNNQANLSILVLAPELSSDFSDYVSTYKKALISQVKETVETVQSILNMTTESFEPSIEILTNETQTVGLIKHVVRNEIDMVIKESVISGKSRMGFSSLDMQLLRYCPCAIWLCRPIEHHRNEISVAVAIDPRESSTEITELSHSLIHSARAQADECSGKLQIISCWDNIIESELKDNVFIKVSQDEFTRQVRAEKQRHLASLQKIVSESGIQGNNTLHQLVGKPENTIPQYVDKHDIDVLVMGTVARTGIPGFFIGNTAENIMMQLNCSLLTLKPQGFVSPVLP